MARSGEVTLEFGTDEHPFRLAIGQWRKVQEVCDAGPPEILARLSPLFHALRQGLTADQAISMGLVGTWRVDDVREPILQGLVGGGMAAELAGRLVRELVDNRPLMDSVPLAYQIVLASQVGAEDEKPLGEPLGAQASPPSQEASSDSDRTASTPSAAPSAGRRGKSTTSRSGSSPPV